MWNQSRVWTQVVHPALFLHEFVSLQSSTRANLSLHHLNYLFSLILVFLGPAEISRPYLLKTETGKKPHYLRNFPAVDQSYIPLFYNNTGATPKGVLRVMGVQGLTIYHVKSHLQVLLLLLWRPILGHVPLLTYSMSVIYTEISFGKVPPRFLFGRYLLIALKIANFYLD